MERIGEIIARRHGLAALGTAEMTGENKDCIDGNRLALSVRVCEVEDGIHEDLMNGSDCERMGAMCPKER